jgi:hypothetical protein
MNFNITDIVTLIEKYGIKGIATAALLFGIYTFIKSEWFGKSLGKISDWFIDKFLRNKVKEVGTSVRKISISDIENHDIFNYVDFWSYSKIPTFQFSTEYRTLVFRKYLTVYLNNYKKNIEKFVAEKKFEEMDEPQILKAFLNLINQTVFDYEKEMVEVGIASIIIEKMKVKNNDNILLTIDLVEGICSSQFYESDKNLLKVYSILNIFMSVLENTINSSETVCNSINGQLKGLSYGGKTEPNK